MKISKSHQNLSDRLNISRVLDHPEEFLGPNWKAVLNFWIYLDTLTDEQLMVINKRFWDMNDGERSAAFIVVEKAAEKATSYWWNVYCVIYSYAGGATWELIGSHELLEQQKSFTFIPLFLNP